MGRTIILGNDPDRQWLKGLEDIPLISVPNIPSNRSDALSDFVNTLPNDVECLIIDADSLNAENTELPLAVALYVRLMIHSCLKTALSHISLVTQLDIDTYKGYGPLSMLLMTSKVDVINVYGPQDIQDIMEVATPLSPTEYVDGFLNLIKVEPQEKVEGRHSIANEWGAEALYNVITGGVKSSIISAKASSSLYFKYSNVVSLNADDVKQIVEGRVPQYLTRKITVSGEFRYLLIDDEAEKGWGKVLSALFPKARQDVWDKPILTYDELSEETKNNISRGGYDLIFLDLRMAGVSEEKILKPEEFSGMRILEAIKKVNKGIQVIMLTATNKAWNVKALLDAGANGYYMKESPEYHFTLKYSEQNALALVNTVKECLSNSYLQDIIAIKKQLILPPDSELSDTIENQLEIALSLILKAKTASDYAFAYISLEQVFEIASSYLIRQETRGKDVFYYFTEDTEEQCFNYTDGRREGYLITTKGGKPAAQWKKTAAIYHQLYGGTDKEFDKKVKDLIALRNKYIHPGDEVKPKITSDNFVDLFNTVIEFLTTFK